MRRAELVGRVESVTDAAILQAALWLPRGFAPDTSALRALPDTEGGFHFAAPEVELRWTDEPKTFAEYGLVCSVAAMT